MQHTAVLTAARAAVAADLADPRLTALLDAAVAHRAWWLEQWPDGAPHVLGLLAQDVQEALHETEPRGPLDGQWPLCPEHREHALFVEPDLGPDPFWCCLVSGLPVAPVGSLNG